MVSGERERERERERGDSVGILFFVERKLIEPQFIA